MFAFKEMIIFIAGMTVSHPIFCMNMFSGSKLRDRTVLSIVPEDETSSISVPSASERSTMLLNSLQTYKHFEPVTSRAQSDSIASTDRLPQIVLPKLNLGHDKGTLDSCSNFQKISLKTYLETIGKARVDQLTGFFNASGNAWWVLLEVLQKDAADIDKICSMFPDEKEIIKKFTEAHKHCEVCWLRSFEQWCLSPQQANEGDVVVSIDKALFYFLTLCLAHLKFVASILVDDSPDTNYQDLLAQVLVLERQLTVIDDRYHSVIIFDQSLDKIFEQCLIKKERMIKFIKALI